MHLFSLSVNVYVSACQSNPVGPFYTFLPTLSWEQICVCRSYRETIQPHGVLHDANDALDNR